MTDAAHLLVDFLSFIISLLSLWLSSRPASHRLSYGWHRAGIAKTKQTGVRSTSSPQCLDSCCAVAFCPLVLRDPGRSALGVHYLAGDGSARVLGCGACGQQRLHHRGHRHAHHLWFCRVGKHYVRTVYVSFFPPLGFSQVLSGQDSDFKTFKSANIFCADSVALS